MYNNYILLIIFITFFNTIPIFFIYRITMREQTHLIFKNVRTIKRTARPNVRVGAHQFIRSSKLAFTFVANVSAILISINKIA